MRTMKRKIPTTFSVDPDQLARMDELAERTGINRSKVIRRAIEIALQEFEAEHLQRVDATISGLKARS